MEAKSKDQSVEAGFICLALALVFYLYSSVVLCLFPLHLAVLVLGIVALRRGRTIGGLFLIGAAVLALALLAVMRSV